MDRLITRQLQRELWCHFTAGRFLKTAVSFAAHMGPSIEALTAVARGAKGHPKQCAALMVACLFRPAFSHRRLSARVGQECAEGGAGSCMMQRILSPPPPMETSYIKPSELALKWKTKRSKQQSPPTHLLYHVVYHLSMSMR